MFLLQFSSKIIFLQGYASSSQVRVRDFGKLPCTNVRRSPTKKLRQKEAAEV
jgi:hypothetical protein